MNLAHMAILRKVEPWYGEYRRVKETLVGHGYTQRRADRAARNRLATKMLAEIFKAVRR